jgi:endogenous inhibitor of DNA gyrase (YacG/DUF329 family)
LSKLRVKCQKCKAIIYTGISMDLKSFCASTLKNNTTTCGNCENQVVWDKEDVLAISFCVV